MAQIVHRGKGQWLARIRRKGYADATKTFRYRKDAEAWAAAVEAKIAAGDEAGFGHLRHLTLADLLAQYRREVTPHKKGCVQETYVLQRLEAGDLGKIRLDRLRHEDGIQYRDHRVQVDGVTPSTVAREISIISAAIKHARSEWPRFKNTKNFVEEVKLAPPPPGRDRRVIAVSQVNELEAIADATRSQHLRDVLVLAVETSMRRSEIINMRRRDVDLVIPAIRLQEGQTKNGEGRWVALSSRALPIIRERIEALPGREQNERLFPVRPDSITKAFIRARERARKLYVKACEARGETPDDRLFVNICFHDMRHEATSRLFERGLTEAMVRGMTGHKDLRSLARYTHINVAQTIKLLG